jgi:hypothetical protein
MDLLGLDEGSELLLEVVGDYATVIPIVSVPRTYLPEELRRKFEARLGAKPTDIPLAEFLGDLGRRSRRQVQRAPKSDAAKDENLPAAALKR